MTREDAIKIFNTVLLLGKCDCPKEEIEECLKMAIKALEQEPNCSEIPIGSTTKNDLGVDAVSRDEVCRYVAEFVNHEFSTREEEELIDNIITGIERMPSVTPQEPRKGHWIDTNDKGFEYHRIYKCSNCEYTVCAYPEEIKRYKFCYGCGSRNEVEE